jgi:glycosyltransferase involved in cell wall biosynthesis
MHLTAKFLKDYQGCYDYLGTMQRDNLRRHYQTAQAFVLPALAEGFAVVILEALSCGLPVLVSRNSGAEGFITPGREGLLHEAQDDDSLCRDLDWMLSHPNEHAEMSHCALQRAQSWTWLDYRREFLRLVTTLTGKGVNRSSLRESLPLSGNRQGPQ